MSVIESFSNGVVHSQFPFFFEETWPNTGRRTKGRRMKLAIPWRKVKVADALSVERGERGLFYGWSSRVLFRNYEKRSTRGKHG